MYLQESHVVSQCWLCSNMTRVFWRETPAAATHTKRPRQQAKIAHERDIYAWKVGYVVITLKQSQRQGDSAGSALNAWSMRSSQLMGASQKVT
jgi:hypothetical protein